MRLCRAISSFFFNKPLSNLAITPFFGPLSSGVDRLSLTVVCQKLKKTVEGSIHPYNAFEKLNRSWNNHDEVERLSNIFIRNNDGNDHFKEHHFLQKVYEGLY